MKSKSKISSIRNNLNKFSNRNHHSTSGTISNVENIPSRVEIARKLLDNDFSKNDVKKELKNVKMYQYSISGKIINNKQSESNLESQKSLNNEKNSIIQETNLLSENNEFNKIGKLIKH